MSATGAGGGKMSHPLRHDPWFGCESAVLSPARAVAWRRWRLRPDASGEPLLGSVHEDHIWQAPTLYAECNPSRTWSYRIAADGEEENGHEPPAEGCRCGIYAYRTPGLARPMGPGVWMHGRVMVDGPMYATDSGYRGRAATIDGPLALVVECAGGEDQLSPTRCLEPPARIRYNPIGYYPVCSSHLPIPFEAVVSEGYDFLGFLDAAALLAAKLDTKIATPLTAGGRGWE